MRRRLRLPIAAVLVIGVIAADRAAAQSRDASGVVLAERSLHALPNVDVTTEDGRTRATTDASGRFVLRGLPSGNVTVLVRAVGYEPLRRVVHDGESELRIVLAELAIRLEEVVTIGTPGENQRRELGNAITVVDAHEVVDRGAASSIHQLLNGRVPGLAVQPSTGSVGGGARMTIRGGTSFSLDNEPLIYVDGVRVNNARSAGPASQSFNSRPISALDDLDPNEIESIEVIKGPSAATLYGTEASSGVINIVTRRGTAGAPRWSLATKQGVNFLRSGGDVFPLNYQRGPNGIITADIVAREASRGTPVFRDGRYHEYSLNVGGGSDQFRYFVAAGSKESQGVTRANQLSKESGRVDLQMTPSSRLVISFDAGYVAGPTRENPEGGLGGLMWSTLMADPRKLPGGGGDSTRRGFFTLLPEEMNLQVERGGKIERDIGRLTTSVNLDHRLTSWLRQRLILGYDQTGETNTGFVPRIDALLPHQALLSYPFGYREVENRHIGYQTFDYAATATLPLPQSLRSSTSIGGQYYGSTNEYVFASGQNFPTEGLSSIAATDASKRVNDEDLVKNVTVGGFVQEQLAWRERLFATLALRADDNSSFGANFDRVYYPKASVSWVLSDEPFFHLSKLSTVRLRAAYGQAGKQPQAFDALRTYGTVSGPADSAAVTPQRIGNPNLGPERGKEVEAGFDLGALQGRLGLEFTYYDKRTTNAILERQYAPSGGFPGTQLFNAGAIRNSGVEIAAHATPLRSTSTTWDVSLTLGTNANRVLSLGDPSVQFVTAGTDLRHVVGYPVGSWFDKRVVSARMDGTGTITEVLCDDAHAGAMPCAGADGTYGTADDAPSVYLGRSIPRAQGAATTSLALLGDRLHFTAVADFAAGQHKLDDNTVARCTLDGGRCRENFFPAEFDARRIAGITSYPRLVDWAIVDASFVKLRELSAAVSLPARYAGLVGATAATLTISGRELHTWTRYPGLETEAMYLGGTYGGSYGATEVSMFPQLSQWLLSVNVTY